LLIEKCFLENYRQFRGKQEIEFSTDPKMNITIISGMNASGKTNLLNAICWCLFGHEAIIGKNVDEHNLPITWSPVKENRARAGNKLQRVMVRLTLRDDLGRRHALNRLVTFQASKTGYMKVECTGMCYLDSKSRLPDPLPLASPFSEGTMWRLIEWFNKIGHYTTINQFYVRYYLHSGFGQDLEEKVPLVLAECEKTFKAIIGDDSRYTRSSLRLSGASKLELTGPRGQIYSLAAEPSEALRFAFLL